MQPPHHPPQQPQYGPGSPSGPPPQQPNPTAPLPQYPTGPAPTSQFPAVPPSGQQPPYGQSPPPQPPYGQPAYGQGGGGFGPPPQGPPPGTPGYGQGFPPPSSSNNRMWLIIVGCFVTVLLIGAITVGAVFVLKDDEPTNRASNTTTPTASEEPSPTETTAPTPSELSGLGFTFDMPRGWKVKDKDTNSQSDGLFGESDPFGGSGSFTETTLTDSRDEITITHVNAFDKGKEILDLVKRELEEDAKSAGTTFVPFSANIPGFVGGYVAKSGANAFYVFADSDNIVMVGVNGGINGEAVDTAEELIDSIRFN